MTNVAKQINDLRLNESSNEEMDNLGFILELLFQIEINYGFGYIIIH
jgi:hypothetical protein